MSVIQRALNATLNMQTQLSDLEASMPLRVFTDLLKADGTLIKTIELTHTSKGIFIDTTEIMPNEQTVYAKHYVYQNDGITLSSNYAVSEERFELIPAYETLFEIRRNGYTEIKVKTAENAQVDVDQSITELNIDVSSNVKISVSDQDTAIETNRDNLNIGVN